ncbi:hypothetical protein [Phycicoccus sp. DTK01]|uniref:hypothetical protein n=1 Tax=Phycicoccus sp. DTK01 TaxID=2785745 RepID=UPI001A908567|nr:hypothetical protein [Phycicoccus sp. DTK01]
MQGRDERAGHVGSSRDSPGGQGVRIQRAGFNTPDEATPAWEYQEWLLYGFAEVERDAWTAEGLRVAQAKVARDLRDAGLVPADLQVQLYGWSVAARVAQGEGAKHVARMLRRQRAAEESG